MFAARGIDAERQDLFELKFDRLVKVWFSKNPSKFLNDENQLRLVRLRDRAPDAEISFVYSEEMLDHSARGDLEAFCTEHSIKPVKIERVIEEIQQSGSPLEKGLVRCYLAEKASFERGESPSMGQLGVMSDIVRWFSGVYNLGVYSDFDVDLGEIPKKLANKTPLSKKVQAPLLLNGGINHILIGSHRCNFSSLCNDIIAVVDEVAAQEKIHRIQSAIILQYSPKIAVECNVEPILTDTQHQTKSRALESKKTELMSALEDIWFIKYKGDIVWLLLSVTLGLFGVWAWAPVSIHFAFVLTPIVPAVAFFLTVSVKKYFLGVNIDQAFKMQEGLLGLAAMKPVSSSLECRKEVQGFSGQLKGLLDRGEGDVEGFDFLLPLMQQNLQSLGCPLASCLTEIPLDQAFSVFYTFLRNVHKKVQHPIAFKAKWAHIDEEYKAHKGRACARIFLEHILPERTINAVLQSTGPAVITVALLNGNTCFSNDKEKHDYITGCFDYYPELRGVFNSKNSVYNRNNPPATSLTIKEFLKMQKNNVGEDGRGVCDLSWLDSGVSAQEAREARMVKAALRIQAAWRGEEPILWVGHRARSGAMIGLILSSLTLAVLALIPAIKISIVQQMLLSVLNALLVPSLNACAGLLGGSVTALSSVGPLGAVGALGGLALAVVAISGLIGRFIPKKVYSYKTLPEAKAPPKVQAGGVCASATDLRVAGGSSRGVSPADGRHQVVFDTASNAYKWLQP